MAQRTFPRPDRIHAQVTGEVLRKHASLTGTPIALPVPIEQIVELSFQLDVLRDEIAEPPGSMILGALSPASRTIVLNERHEDLFESVIGPENFTLAHELAHWIYDADDPAQLSLDLEQGTPVDQFCYHRESPGLDDDLRIREVNANKFASHLLLPESLVRAADLDAVLRDLRGTARRWGVSQQCLRIRLEGLDVLSNEERINLLW
jgi:Zn-dependent peptidase ImmA (M78 family)